MKTSSVKAKGRRLQVVVAEAISACTGLTIEASPPTKPGSRSNGAVYAPEGMGDLKIRRMGEPGQDVAVLSERGLKCLNPIRPIRPWIECKNDERLSFDRDLWGRTQTIPVAERAFRQILKADPEAEPIVVLSKNRWSPLVVLKWVPVFPPTPMLVYYSPTLKKAVAVVTLAWWASCQIKTLAQIGPLGQPSPGTQPEIADQAEHL